MAIQPQTSKAKTSSIEKPGDLAEKPKNFAAETREQYEKLKDKAESIPEKVATFVKEGGKHLLKEFEQGNLLKKIAILGGVAGVGYLAYKGLKKLGELIGSGFKSLFGLGEKLKEGLEEAKDSTVLSILKLALGGTLAAGVVTMLHEAINGKIPLTEILEAWKKGGVKGIGLLLLKKQKDGVISMGKEAWEAAAPVLGLPPLEKVQEKLAGVKEEIEKGYEWLDEKCHFGEVKARMEKYFEEHHIAMPEWMKKLNLSEMAKDLGISEADPKTWAEFAVAGGAALMIYKWAGKKALLVNAAAYLFIVREGKASFGGQLLMALSHDFDEAKKKFFAKWRKNSDVAGLLDYFLEDFSLEKHIESSLDWIGEHPAESMVAMNGMWILRGVIVKGVKMAGKSALGVSKYAITNPGKMAVITAGVAALYAGRREFIQDFVDITYDDPKSKEATEMRENLDNMLSVDRTKGEGVAEKQSHDFLKSLLEDPIKALNLASTIEAFQKGVFALGFDLGGKVVLLIKGLNVPIQLAGLTKEAFKSLPLIYASDYEGNRLATTTTVGAELIVLGSLTYMTSKESLAATKTIFDMNDKGALAVGKVFKSLIPGTKEWRFVFKSMITAPLIPIMKNMQGAHIGKIESEMKKLSAEIAAESPDFKKIQKMATELGDHHMFKDYEKIKETLSGTRFGYEFAKKFGDVKRTIRSIEEAAKKQDVTEIQNMKNLVRDIEENTAKFQSGVSRLIERWELLKEGKVSAAFAKRSPTEDAELAAKESAEAPYKPLSSQETFRKADGSYKTEAELRAEKAALEREAAALDATNPIKKAKQKTVMAIEAFLDPSKVDHMGGATAAEIRALDSASKASRLEDLALRMEAAEKGVQEKFLQEVNTVVKSARTRGISLADPAVKSQLEALQAKYIDPLAHQKGATLKLITEEYKALPKALRTPAMKRQIKNILEATDGTMTTRLVKSAKGRMKLMAVMAGLMFATDALIHKDDPERELITMMQELGPDLGQLIVDVIPGVGTVSNFYAAIAGKESVSGKDVSGASDRASNVAWGVVGLAGDILTVLGSVPSAGTSVAGNVFLRLTKAAKGGSKTAVKLIEMWPRFEKLAEKMGGFKKLAEKILKYTHENKSVIGKGLRTTERVSMAAGTALLAGGVGYHLYFKDSGTPEIEVPDDLDEVSVAQN